MDKIKKILAEYKISVSDPDSRSDFVFVSLEYNSPILGDIVNGFNVHGEFPKFLEDFAYTVESYKPDLFARSWITSENARATHASLEALVKDGEKIKSIFLSAKERLGKEFPNQLIQRI